VSPLDGLLQSYLDLRWHLDPAAASAADVVSADMRLGAFDAQAMREHLAAFRAIAGAIEDLELEALDDEIDRTALLADVRSTIARFEEDRPHVRDPGFWVGHIRHAIASLLGRTDRTEAAPAALARISAMPAFLDAARATIRRPPVLLVDAALARLGPLGELLVRAASECGSHAPGGVEAMNAAVSAALQALARFGAALRDEIEPEVEWSRAALGEDRFERRIQEAYAVRSSTAELARWAAEMLEADAPPGPDPTEAPSAAGDLATAQERAMASLASPIRRTLRSPVAVEGWALYAVEADTAAGPERIRRLREAAGRLAADVGLHAGGMNPADAARLLTRSGMAPEQAEREVRQMAAEPTRGLAAAAGYRDILRLRRAYAAAGDSAPDHFHAALLRYGALPPGLAGWGMGLDG
jgi:hypothetical protein